ncbi:hypothetical protein HKBW3S43_00782 [Candidatus Hakubella thermalkaliphila]|uniref:Glycosyltransferase RgtA/B/C/D-like domain-containing protein n=1 Tax=Candidatus Hakubella thermalkaliphila TaxID=2754717 RepID=A0A6V8PSC8_9ACTN|nr:hypothetical protein HKBW3S43_00782 [Candidatus Hakubella thermalkaliphila]
MGRAILLLAFCAVGLVYWRWFLPGAITWGDWLYLTKATLADFTPTLWGSDTGLGAYRIISAPLFPILMLQRVLSQALHLDYSVIERLLWFYPFVLLSVTSPWYLARTLGYRRSGAAAVILVFSLNTYMFFIAGQLTVGMAQVLGPLVVAVFVRTVERPFARAGLLLGLAASLQMVYDVRIFYVTTLFCGLYLLYFLIT